jgi:hypothetical protein
MTTRPRWSPDRTKIAFQRFEGSARSQSHVYLMDADGGNLERKHPPRVPTCLVARRHAHRVRQRERYQGGDLRDERFVECLNRRPNEGERPVRPRDRASASCFGSWFEGATATGDSRCCAPEQGCRFAALPPNPSCKRPSPPPQETSAILAIRDMIPVSLVRGIVHNGIPGSPCAPVSAPRKEGADLGLQARVPSLPRERARHRGGGRQRAASDRERASVALALPVYPLHESGAGFSLINGRRRT